MEISTVEKDNKKPSRYDIDSRIFKQDDKIITHQSQDCTEAIKSAKVIRDVNGGKSQLGYYAAKIPMVMLLQWGQEDAGDQMAYLQGRHNKDPELAKKLAYRMNSNEFNALRVWEGNVAASDIMKEGNKH
jgi:hypothetical protein